MTIMRELSTPSLFDSSLAIPTNAAVSELPPLNNEEKRSDKLAKDFVRWCFSFGADFRNSPDVINLRTWAQKAKLKLKDSEEREFLDEARRLYLKRIEQMMKRPDMPILAAPTEDPA